MVKVFKSHKYDYCVDVPCVTAYAGGHLYL